MKVPQLVKNHIFVGPNCTSLTLTRVESAAFPGLHLPQFSYSYNSSSTENETFSVGFSDIVSTLGTGLFIIPLMAYLESISIAKGFAIKNDYKVDATQELVRFEFRWNCLVIKLKLKFIQNIKVAIGLSNLISALFSSYPVTGSFSRTAVNSQSNVATPAGGIVCGSLVCIDIKHKIFCSKIHRLI